METYITIQISDQYDTQIIPARRFTDEEKKGYAEWFAATGFVGIGEHESLPHVTQSDVFKMLNRRCDGSYNGCTNTAWIITSEQAEILRKLNSDRTAAKAIRQEAESKTASEYDQRVGKHICPHCHTFCDGDCQA